MNPVIDSVKRWLNGNGECYSLYIVYTIYIYKFFLFLAKKSLVRSISFLLRVPSILRNSAISLRQFFNLLPLSILGTSLLIEAYADLISPDSALGLLQIRILRMIMFAHLLHLVNFLKNY